MTNNFQGETQKTSSLTSEKRKLFIRQLRQQNLGQQKTNTIPRKNGRVTAPLSLMQQRMWLQAQIEPDCSINNVIRILHLRGDLNQAALESALNKITARHEILRTTFAELDGEAMQHIAHHSEFRLTTINLRNISPDQRQEEVKSIARSEAQHFFDLSRDTLIRVVLIKLDQQEYALIITLHHIVSDGWSTGVLYREMETFYRSSLRNEPAILPDLPLQYTDFAEWQRDWFQGDAVAPIVDFWKKELLNAPRLELPFDRCYTKQPDHLTEMRSLQLSAELTGKIKQLGQNESCTLFMTLLACFNVLLHRYSGETDIVIGTPILGRHGLDEIKDLIGCFVNTLALRTDLSGDPSFRQLLGRVCEMALRAYRHSTLPFDKLVEILHPDRVNHRNPLFDVMINIHEASWHEFRLDGLNIEEWKLVEPLSDVALSLDLMLDNDCLLLTLKYQPALFDEWRINLMLGHLKTLLEGCVANPDQSISKSPLLTEHEQQQILKEWNSTGKEYPSDKTIHVLFEEQVQATPDAVALIFENQQLSYAELNARANQLAHLLIAKGIETETTVALLMDRSTELLISILAILKAGGAYVPLDPKHPWERLQTILDDAAPKLLLTTGGQYELLAGYLNVSALNIDTLQSDSDAEDQRNPDSLISPDNLAYVLYTSGSTGIPKGVMIEHGSVINLACALQTQVFDSFDKRPLRVALNTAITFDASVQQWTRLLWGDCIVIFSEEVSRDAQALVAALRARYADVLGCSPTQLHLMFDEGLFNDAGNCPAIVLCGGEAIDTELWRLASTQQHSHIYNVYGPTECTVDSTSCLLDAKTGIPNIGRPLANMQAYILDRNHQPVPIGIPGELWLGGAGVGRGYLNKPELTVSRFIPDTYANSPNARLYNTGDRARYMSDGNIEFLGRADGQVKLRGFRIELGEIESVLRQHPSVKNAVTIVREDTPGDQRLAAYVISSNSVVNTLELTSMLKAKLPEYMVPADIVFLETLPLTSSGKVDRKSLPAPAHDRSRLDNKFIAPRTLYEKEIARIWGEVMSSESPGVHDNFFELGGHSLLATRVISRINCTFGIQLPLREIFESPTIAGLAQALLVNKSLVTQEILPQKNTLKALADRSSLPLSFAQQRLWFLDQFEHGSANYNIPCAYHIRGSLNIDALRHALNEVVRRHESLRTTFAMQGDEPVQVIAPDLELAIPLLEANDEATLHNLIIAEAKRTFDLQQGPLLNAQIIRLAAEDHALFFNQHHIISDGWSMGVFLRELNQLYAAFIKGEPSLLAEPGLQYADYAVWQRQQGEALAKQLDYWKQKLAAPPVLELPTDRPRPAVQRYRGAILSWHVAAPLTAQLKQLAQQEHVTLFMLLMATFQTLLYRYSGQEDFTVGSPVAGRNRSELEGMIGLFVNTMVLRADLSGSPTFLQLLTQVRETSLAAFSHQDIPFEKLVEELLSTRDMSRNPLFQVMFTLQSTPSSQLALDGVEVEPIEIPIETGKFDLSLAVTESNQNLECTFNYNTDLFDKTTIERMAGHLQNLLQEVAINPQRSVAELPLLTEDEKQQILKQWNNTNVDYQNDATIQQLIKQQVDKTPDAIALVFNEHKLTYRELNKRANQLAHHLISEGVRPETLIGICLERSLEMVIAILGVLKSGAAYVPLDPAHPVARLKDILNDAQVPLLLCSNNTATKLADTSAKRIVLDGEWSIIADCADNNPAPCSTFSNAAYVIYTSGSTGKPKGVINHQAGICNRLLWMQQAFQLSGNDAVLQKTPYSFDVSVWEFLWPLMTGARLVLAKAEGHKDPVYLNHLIAEENITVIHFVPSMLQLFLDVLEGEQHCCSLRYVICSGEALNSELVKSYYNRLNAPLHNLYGPTEAAIDVTHWSCSQNTPIGNVPIGVPIANTYIRLLDAQLRLVPIGIAGELHIGGVQLARGYLNRSELTAERFIKDPYNEDSDARLYRTGDLARYLPNGNIEYLGRMDFQVKLRGFRIELGEIESVLRQHVAVKDAVVTLREDRPGDQRLAAYIILSNSSVSTLELMNMLKAKLPEYMVPADIVFLETLPLTSNGKIDRKSLPAPAHDHSRLGNKFIAPRTPYEKEIARIWGEVMSLENPGIHDNFFELGGHSLLATRVISRINFTFGIQLPLREIFESPTIVGLAQALLINKSCALQEVALAALLDQLEKISEAEAEQLFAEKTAGGKS